MGCAKLVLGRAGLPAGGPRETGLPVRPVKIDQIEILISTG